MGLHLKIEFVWYVKPFQMVKLTVLLEECVVFIFSAKVVQECAILRLRSHAEGQ
jgi:hypothetical protein